MMTTVESEVKPGPEAPSHVVCAGGVLMTMDHAVLGGSTKTNVGVAPVTVMLGAGCCAAGLGEALVPGHAGVGVQPVGV